MRQPQPSSSFAPAPVLVGPPPPVEGLSLAPPAGPPDVTPSEAGVAERWSLGYW